MSENSIPDVEQAINKLTSFHDGDAGVLDGSACGERAIPALRALLFERDPSGLFQSRRRAVEALAKLKAHAVVIDYLETERAANDPVERLGDDAVINAAAQALAEVRDERIFQLLMRLAQRRSLTGVIRALGAFRRPEALPLLIDALEDDASRQQAKAALTTIGRAARPALIAAVKLRLPSSEQESESSLRRRRSALAVLQEIGISQRMWPELRGLIEDPDAKISVLACGLCLMGAPAMEHRNAVHRLLHLIPNVDWMLRDEIEDCLKRSDTTREIIRDHIRKMTGRDIRRSRTGEL